MVCPFEYGKIVGSAFQNFQLTSVPGSALARSQVLRTLATERQKMAGLNKLRTSTTQKGSAWGQDRGDCHFEMDRVKWIVVSSKIMNRTLSCPPADVLRFTAWSWRVNHANDISEIRLLHMQRQHDLIEDPLPLHTPIDHDSQAVSYTLELVSIGDLSQYTALSYVWGDLDDPLPIVLTGRKFKSQEISTKLLIT